MIRNSIYTVLSFLLVFLTGCSYDEPFDAGQGNGGANLTVMVPSAALARESGLTRGNDIFTRASAQTAMLKEKEATMTKMYLAGFYTPKGSTTKKHFFYELTPEMGVAVDGIYRSFSFNVEEGSYNLYMLVNMDINATLKGNLENRDYGDVSGLENSVLNLQKTYSATTLPALSEANNSARPGLPIAGKLTGVSVSKSTPTQALIPLEFLCAKVRLTLIHEESLGLTGGHVTQLSASNLYTPSNIFSGATQEPFTGAGSPFQVTTDAAAVSGHFELTNEIRGAAIGSLASISSSLESDPIEHLGAEITNFTTCKENAYQGVIYLPESPVITDVTKSTKINATFSMNANGTNSKTYAFAVGCDKTTDAINPGQTATSNSQVKRGHFYDIVARLKGGDIEVYYSVVDWELDDLSMELAGYSNLYLAKTVLESVSGSDVERIPYQTDAPSLSFESPTMKVGDNDVPIFSMRENKEEGVIEVSLGSGVGLGQSVPSDKRYFWVKAGTIRKRVNVSSVDTQAFVRLTPKDRNISIAQIINSDTYILWYEYSTNMDLLTLTLPLADYKNKNINKGSTRLSVRIYTGTEQEYYEYSEESGMPATGNIVISGLSKLEGITEDASKSGLIGIMIKEPSDQAAFGQEITGKITAKGKCTDASVSDIEASSTFTINPTPSKYVIHFKAIKTKDDGTLDTSYKWETPHCYVYQPLVVTYAGTNSTYKGEEIYVMDTGGGLNWLEYSFTGKAVFKGWKSELGTVDDFNTENPAEVTQGGQNILAYKKWGSDGSSLGGDQYFLDIDLIPEFREKVKTAGTQGKINCNSGCKNGECSATWPGISMIQETAAEVGADGWWRIELPMIAQPGLALVMFANTHTDSNASRYPGNNVPGIPLPNYASKEAWFLYDANSKYEDQLSFSDQRRESYAGEVSNREGEWVSVAFRAPLDAGDSGIQDYLRIGGDASDKDNKVIIGPNGVKYAGKAGGYSYWTTQIFVDNGGNKSVTDYIKTYQFGSSETDTNGSTINWSANRHKEETDSELKQLYGNCNRLFTIWTNNTTTAPTPPSYVVVYWPTTLSNATKIYMWRGTNKPFGEWSGTLATTSGSYRYVWAKQSAFHNGTTAGTVPTLSEGYQYILNDGNSQGGDKNLDSANAEIKTIVNVATEIRNKVPGPITGVIYIKNK